MSRITEILSENRKKIKYARSFIGGKIVHTNLQLHYRCNFKCRICDFWKNSRDRARLTAADIRIISERLKEIGPQIVSIGGGEPLMHRELPAIVSTLSRNHFPVMICNGWFVTPKIARTLFAAGMYEISISVDYINPAKHDAQRGLEGAHKRAIQALRVLQENRTRSHQRVHMITVIMDDNLDEIEPLIRLCRYLGITYMVTLYSDNRGEKQFRTIPADVSRHLLGLHKKYREFVSLRGYIGDFSQAVAENGIGPCQAGRNLMNIDSNGNVSLCIDRLDDPVGNILQDEAKDLVEKLAARYRNNDCRSCWTSCRGSIESVRYRGHLLRNLYDYHRMVRSVPLSSIPAGHH